MKKYYDFLPDVQVGLAPCPFCGGKADLYGVFVPIDEDEINVWICGCRKCDINFSQKWEWDEIVTKWNTRPGQFGKEQIIERLNRTKPLDGKDNSHARIRYIQWLSDWHSINALFKN